MSQPSPTSLFSPTHEAQPASQLAVHLGLLWVSPLSESLPGALPHRRSLAPSTAPAPFCATSTNFPSSSGPVLKPWHARTPSIPDWIITWLYPFVKTDLGSLRDRAKLQSNWPRVHAPHASCSPPVKTILGDVLTIKAEPLFSFQAAIVAKSPRSFPRQTVH
jgi:hypothetical protein